MILKNIFFLSLLFVGSSYFAIKAEESSLKCDLSVQTPRFEGETKINVSSPRFTSSKSCQEAKNDALESCQSKGGQECALTEFGSYYKSTMFSTYRGVWECSAIAVGYKVSGGRKLTDSEYAKKRLSLLCQKIDKCVENALNDEKASTTYIDKLYQIKNHNNCNQVENFIFQN